LFTLSLVFLPSQASSAPMVHAPDGFTLFPDPTACAPRDQAAEAAHRLPPASRLSFRRGSAGGVGCSRRGSTREPSAGVCSLERCKSARRAKWVWVAFPGGMRLIARTPGVEAPRASRPAGQLLRPFRWKHHRRGEGRVQGKTASPMLPGERLNAASPSLRSDSGPALADLRGNLLVRHRASRIQVCAVRTRAGG
jgi:hypothetical protein